MDMRRTVRDFIVTNFYVEDPDALADDDSLLDRGIIDSTGVLEVIEFLEQELQIVVEDAEMVPANLDSISRIVTFVAKKRADRAA